MKQVLLCSVKNRLTIHPIKTEAMILKKSTVVGLLLSLYFGTGLIDMVDSTTCLGLKIDNGLSWSVDIDSVKKHFIQKVGALKRMGILPKQSLEEIYFKSIIPSVTYSISVWGNCLPSLMNSLNSIHARAFRVINNLQPSVADDTCLPFSYFYKKSVLVLIHNVYFETWSQSVDELFSKNATSRSTRFPNQFNIIRFKSDTGRNTLQYRGPVILIFLNRS